MASLTLYGNTSGTVTLQANSVASTNTLTLPNTTGTLAMDTTLAYKNRFLNGSMQIAQRGTSATVVAGTGVPTVSTGYPCVDRWFVYSTGANITAAQVAGSGNNQNNLQITGAASVTAVGVGQRIEQLNSYDLAGQTVTLSVNMSNSLLTNVTWIASYANTANTFGTIGTPTKTQIATGTFTVSSTLTQYSTQISIPSAATTGVEILFTVGAQTSGTWVIGSAQLELGSQATSFDTREYSREFSACQRYFETFGTGGVGISRGGTAPGATMAFSFKVTKRTSPTVTLNASSNIYAPATGTYTANAFGGSNGTTPNGISCDLNTSGTTASLGTTTLWYNSGDNLWASAEIA